jgi:hypothetical protein
MNNNRDLFTGNLTAEPELNCPPKGTVVVNASLANNELYISEGGKRQQITRSDWGALNAPCRTDSICAQDVEHLHTLKEKLDAELKAH